MHHFRYTGQNLHCESVDLAEVARLYGTPTYVYSATTMGESYGRLAANLAGLDFQICFASKANGNLAVLKHFGNLGAAFDLASGGELRRVLAAGLDVKRSVFAGVGKTEPEIRLALEQGIFGLHVESEPELARINHVAGTLGLKAPVAIRINPDVDAHSHAKISTGLSEHKFGIPLKYALAAYESAAQYPHVTLKGVQMHIGSQITEAGPIAEAVAKLAPVAVALKAKFGIGYCSIGGGIGIAYHEALAGGETEWSSATTGRAGPGRESGPSAVRGENAPGGRVPIAPHAPLTPETYGATVVPILRELGLKILLEPGRFLTGNAGVLLTRVEYLKRGSGKNFLIVDAGMNDLMRPALYDAYHEIVPLHRDSGRRSAVFDVVGPVCESSDCFARGRTLQEVGEGEYLALMSAGAYGFSMANRYNARGLPAEVLVQGSAFELIKSRDTFDQMVAGERIPAFLN